MTLEAASTTAPVPSGRDALVFSGGGILFAIHVGVLAEMAQWTSGPPAQAGVGTEAKRWLDHFQVVVGTSAGALYGALFASGLTPAQIALYARIFADPEVGPTLFDRNLAGAGAAFIRHNGAYALGAVRGMAIQTLLETVFSKPVHAHLRGIDPASVGEPGWKEVRTFLIDAWKQRRRRRRDKNYYKDQLTFADCTRELFIIGVNAYSGQKTIFAKRPHHADWAREKAEDDAMYAANAPPYLNAPGVAELKAREAELRAGGEDMALEFRRFVNRVYRAYDTETYGSQLPLALAVRASLSIPVIFEPLRIRRWRPTGTTRDQEDLFIDGGVEDNFSLSVAIDPALGNARHVLGVSLGNLGYRLPDAAAAANVLAVLNKTTSYMGDALLDLSGAPHALAGHRVLVINALTSTRAALTDTNLIGQLIADGGAIARDFWSRLNGGAPYPGPTADCDWSLAFAHDPKAIYLSAAARGVAPQSAPLPLDMWLRPREVWQIPLNRLRGEWLLVYIVVGLIALGVGTALYVVIDAIGETIAGHPLRALGGLLSSLVVGLVSVIAGILLARLLAFGYWRNRSGRQR